jgi:hypothetical protein
MYLQYQDLIAERARAREAEAAAMRLRPRKGTGGRRAAASLLRLVGRTRRVLLHPAAHGR